MKKKPPVTLRFESFFYEEDCQSVCLSWIGKVPACDIIKTAHAAYRSIIFSDAGLSFPTMKRRYGLSFDIFFRSNRLLFTELLVAIERSHRSPTHEQLSFSTDQAPYTYGHHLTRPNTPPGERLKPVAVAAMMTEVTGRVDVADSLRKAADREVLERKRTDAHWIGTLVEEEKHPLFTAAFTGEPVANIAVRAMLAGRTSDPKRQSNSQAPTRSKAGVLASIKRAKALSDKHEVHLKLLLALATTLNSSRTK